MSYMSAQEIRDVMHEQDSDSPPETPIDSVVATSDFSIPDAEDDYLYKRAADAAIVADEEKRKLINDEDLMSNLRFYMHKRFDDDGKQELDESDEAFYDRYMTHFRWMTNNSYSLGKEIDFMRKAAPETRQAFGKVFERVENEAPTLTDMSAGEAFNALGDYVYATATDPLNVAQAGVTGFFTGGIGAVASITAKNLVQREALKKALTMGVLGKARSKHVVKGTLAGSAFGASQAAVEDAMIQELEQQGYIGEGIDGEVVFDASKSYEDRKTDIGSVLTSALAGGVLGAGEGFLQGRAAKKQAVNYVNDRLRLKDLQGSLNNKFDLMDQDGKFVDAVTFDPVQGDMTNTLLKNFTAETAEGKVFAPTIERLTKDVKPFDRAVFDQLEVEGVVEGAAKDALTQAQLRTTLTQEMDRVAAAIYKTKVEQIDASTAMDVELTGDVLLDIVRYSKDKQASDITKDIWLYLAKDVKEDDWNLVESAMSKYGIDSDDFTTLFERISATGPDGQSIINDVAHAFKVSKSEAGRTLQGGSVLGKAMKEFRTLNKAEKARLDKVFGAGDTTTANYMNLYNFMQKVGKVRRGLMVINPATTVRNMFSGNVSVTFSTGSNAIESVLYNMGKTVTGKQDIGKSLNEIWLDSSGLITSLIKPRIGAGPTTGGLDVTRAKAIADAALINNSSLSKRLFRSNANFDGDGSLPGFVTALNGLNIAQDAFFRRSIFAYELDKSFRRAGIEGGLEATLKSNKTIPTNILEEAGAATMKATFSYAPRRNKGLAENSAAEVLNIIEKAPLPLTVALPFARFMYNAMAFQLKYSPLNIASNAFQAMQVAAFKGRKEVDFDSLRKSFASSTVGTAALMAAMKIRSDNQDQPYYNVRVGDTVVNTKALFPLTPYLLVADLILKAKPLGIGVTDFNESLSPDEINRIPLGRKDILEGFAGLNIAKTATLPLLDQLLANAQSYEGGSAEKKFEFVAKSIGDYAGSFLVGTNFAKDVIGAFDAQEAMQRDYNAAVEGNGGMERGLSAFTQTVKKAAPIFVQEALGLEKAPAKAFAYREPGEVAYRESSLLKQTTGATTVRKANDVERHLDSQLGLPEWVTFRSSGDKAADNYTRAGASQFANGYIQSIMKTEGYNNLAFEQKREYMSNVISKIKKEARIIGETFNQSDLAIKASQIIKETDTEIQAIINKDNGVTDNNEAALNKLLRKQLLYKNYQWTGPFARSRWLRSTDKKEKALATVQFKAFADNAQQKQNRGEELSDYERLLLLAPRPTVESSGLYGLGHLLAKELARSLKP